MSLPLSLAQESIASRLVGMGGSRNMVANLAELSREGAGGNVFISVVLWNSRGMEGLGRPRATAPFEARQELARGDV